MTNRIAPLLLIVGILLLAAEGCHSSAAWTHTKDPPCSLITKEEASKALRQPVREPVSHQYLSIDERDRRQIQELVDQGVVWMSTCEYNGVQTRIPMDFLSAHIYQFTDKTRANAFYSENSKPRGKAGDGPEMLAPLKGLCDKSAEMQSNAVAEVWVLNKDVVFTLSARAGMPSTGEPIRSAVESLFETAVRRLK